MLQDSQVFPLTCCRRTKYRVDHGHIADSILERDGLRPVLSNRLREERALDLVLIASRNLNHLIVDENLSGPIVRRIEWNQHLDSSFRAVKNHSLIRIQPCATCKRRVTLRKVEHRTRQRVRTRNRISLNDAKHAPRLRCKDEARDVNRITPDIHQRAAAERKFIANVLRIGIEVTEKSGNGRDRTYSA